LAAQVPLGPVPSGQEIELYATLRDNYKNPGRNRLVRWFAEGPNDTSSLVVIRPVQNYADVEGVTRVFVSSPSGGTYTISVRCEANDSELLFEPISFVGAATHQ
jgi:hypothetical protein